MTEDGQAAMPVQHWGLQLDPVPGKTRFLQGKIHFRLKRKIEKC